VNGIYSLELDIVDDPDVLLRVVGVCHQRGCRILSLHYERTTRIGSLTLGVEAESSRAERLEMWLAKIVNVLAVRTSIGSAE
jgi:acetolactate synthase regulatory subunit